MFEVKKSIIISNILDPLSKDPDDLKEVYKRLIKENRYDSFETRTIKDESLIEYFNQIRKPNIKTTYYVTGDLSRIGISLSSAFKDKREKAIDYCKKELAIAYKTNCTSLGIASGAIEDNALLNLDYFIKSIEELVNYIKANDYKIKLAIEPLDQYAHKRNVVGITDMTLRLVDRLCNKDIGIDDFFITWDAAHVALNEDDFEESIKALRKYIYRIHFASAILDKDNPLYGDYHLDFDYGFMNLEVAKRIVSYARNYIDHPVEFACEIRAKERDECWLLENKTYEFLMKALLQ